MSNLAYKTMFEDEYYYIGSFDADRAKFLILECCKTSYRKVSYFCSKNNLSYSIWRFCKGIRGRDKSPLSVDDIKAIIEHKEAGSFVTLDMLMLAFGYVKSSDIKNLTAFLTPEQDDYIDLRTLRGWERLNLMEDEEYAESKRELTRNFCERFNYNGDDDDPFLTMMAEKYSDLESKNDMEKITETRRKLHGEKVTHNSKYEIRMDGIESIFAYI